VAEQFAGEGTWRATAAVLRQIWDLAKRNGATGLIATACQNLSVALKHCGDHAAANSMLQQASRAEMDAWIDSDDIGFSGHHLLLESSRLADIEPSQAMRLATDAAIVSDPDGNYLAVRQHSAIQARSGDVAAAANRLAALYAIAAGAGDQGVLPDLLLELSSLQIAMSQFDVAANSLRIAITHFQRQGRSEEAGMAQLRLGECQLLNRLWGADPACN
jgi:hypothetical protein